MTMKLSALTKEGVSRLNDFLHVQKSLPSSNSPSGILEDANCVEPIGDAPMIDEGRIFANRFEFAQYMDSLLGSRTQLLMNADVWAWLTVVYFDQVCPVVRGVRQVRDKARYIPALGNFRKLYRHLLLGPLHAYRAHGDAPERARVMLAGPLHSPGELAEQLMAAQERMTNRAVIDVASTLYLDPRSGRPKPGAGGKLAGSPRRFVDVLNQLDLTYDLYSLSESQLMAMLPMEFDRFRAKARGGVDTPVV